MKKSAIKQFEFALREIDQEIEAMYRIYREEGSKEYYWLAARELLFLKKWKWRWEQIYNQLTNKDREPKNEYE